MSARATVAEVAALVGGRLVSGPAERAIRRVMPMDRAAPDGVGFIAKSEYLPALRATHAGAVLLSPAMLEAAQAELEPRDSAPALILVDHPYAAFARVAQVLAPPPPHPLGRHLTALVDPSAQLGADVALGAFVVIGPRARIGRGATLYPGVHVEADAEIGEGSILYDHVVVRYGCRVGARNILHPGVVIGADGFGFAQEPTAEGPRHLKLPQIGDVVLEDDVELGAQTCVDRGALGTTRVGRGTKVDNLVQIGHNVELGEGCILVAQSGVAGSSRLGRHVTLGAQSGIAGHLHIGDGVTVLGQAGVMNDLAPGTKVAGTPAVGATEFFRSVVRIGKLDELGRLVRRIERSVFGKGNVS